MRKIGKKLLRTINEINMAVNILMFSKETTINVKIAVELHIYTFIIKMEIKKTTTQIIYLHYVKVVIDLRI